MKRINKLAASIAVVLSLGVVSQANALIEMESDSKGDALMFPVFYGYGENYFTIMNNDNNWIQGHLRFRGASWCGELLDMDIILSPGDVFVFRLADIDGDGFWEIDQSLDEKNFKYTGMLSSCGQEDANGNTLVKDKPNCMDQSSILIPEANNNDTPPGNITEALITHHRNVGQVEFIAEGVLLPRSTVTSAMGRMIDTNNAGKLATLGQRQVGNKLGTHLWSWVDGYNAYPTSDGVAPGFFQHEDFIAPETTRFAADVGNVLTGSAFINMVGQDYGLAYNAEAFINFRTTEHNHRVETYPKDEGVILHHESASAIPGNYWYVYGYKETGQQASIDTAGMESRISFNNTWGPTLADGDDYLSDSADYAWLSNVTENTDLFGQDGWDLRMGVNSITEVQEAVRRKATKTASYQSFSSFYYDNSDLSSWYVAFFPTMFYYGEDVNHWKGNVSLADTISGVNVTDELLDKRGYLSAAVEHLLNTAKPYNIEVWDINESAAAVTIESGPECVVSPCKFSESIIQSHEFPIREQVAVFTIKDLKRKFGPSGSHMNWDSGRVVMEVASRADICRGNEFSEACQAHYPGLLYTFEKASEAEYEQWRPMHRGAGPAN